jgi:hypothetical protein
VIATQSPEGRGSGEGIIWNHNEEFLYLSRRENIVEEG